MGFHIERFCQVPSPIGEDTTRDISAARKKGENPKVPGKGIGIGLYEESIIKIALDLTATLLRCQETV